jgi:hypothetical protein
VNALESHIRTLQGDDDDALKEQLTAAEARAEKQAAELGTDLAAEKARTEMAIVAFSAMAERLDALAAKRTRPWWRRLTG